MKLNASASKLKELITNKNIIAFLKEAKLSFEIDLSLKILPNRNGHLYAIMFRDHDKKNPITDQLDPKDLEALLSQFRAKIQAPITLTPVKAKYDGEIYSCVYIDLLAV